MNIYNICIYIYIFVFATIFRKFLRSIEFACFYPFPYQGDSKEIFWKIVSTPNSELDVKSTRFQRVDKNVVWTP